MARQETGNNDGLAYIVTDGRWYRSFMHDETLARQALIDEEKEHQGERFPTEPSTWRMEILDHGLDPNCIPNEQLGFVLVD